MKFNALPVKEGDAFLLELQDQIILVDSGKDENECREFLIRNNISKLDLFICTHYDADHINGILAILKSQIQVKEVWFPSVVGKINETLNNKSNCEVQHFLEINSYNREKDIEENKTVFCCLLYRVEDNEIEYCIIKDKNSNVKNFILKSPYQLSYQLNKTQLHTIHKIVNECKEKKIKIKWLKYIDDYVGKQISKSFDIYGLNCIETNNVDPFKRIEELLYYLTPINIESLVFKYENVEYPNILFCADSNFKFLEPNAKIQLRDNSISTVAHHGSKDNSRTFNLIDGKNVIYVRSDSKNRYRPSEKFISLNNIKYCTICNFGSNSYNSKHIILCYTQNIWTSSIPKCTCQ